MNVAPGYWMNETSGVLRPAVEAYLEHRPLTPDMIAALRAYLRQWIEAPRWAGGKDLDELRLDVVDLDSRASIRAWLDRAEEIGIDPL